MSVNKFNALAAVKGMAVDDEDEQSLDENKDQDDISSFLDVTIDETAKPLKSILKKKDHSEDMKVIDGVEESVTKDFSSTYSIVNNLEDDGKTSSTVSKNGSATLKSKKRFVLKVSGLPYDMNVGEFIAFLGTWPKDGYDGVKVICDSAGDPSGYAYVEVDSHYDKMNILQSSGIMFKNRAVVVSMSSANAMEIEWNATKRIQMQIKKSPFIRIGNLPFTMSTGDIMHILSKYRRTAQDVYCWSDNPDQENSGYCYVIMDNKSQADKVCKTNLSFNNRRLCPKKIHPEVLSRWCIRNNLKFIVRDCIKYDMSVDVSPPHFEDEEDDEESGNESLTGNTSDILERRNSSSPTNAVAKEINMDPHSSVFIYDPDAMNINYPGENEKTINTIYNDESSSIVMYDQGDAGKSSKSGPVLINKRNSSPKRPEGRRHPNIDFNGPLRPPHPNLPPFNPREMPFRPPPFGPGQFHPHFDRFRFPPQPNRFMSSTFHPPGVDEPVDFCRSPEPGRDEMRRSPHFDAGNMQRRPLDERKSPDFTDSRKIDSRQMNFPDSRTFSDKARNFSHRKELTNSDTPPNEVTPDEKQPPRGQGPPVPMHNQRMEMSPGNMPMPFGGGPPGMFRPAGMFPLPGPQRLPFPPGLPGPPVLPGPPRLPGPMGFPPGPRMFDPRFRPCPPIRCGFIPTVYLRMYDVPDDATTEDVKDFFKPIIPAKIAQNVGTDLYDVDFYKPDDAMMALRRSGSQIKNKIVRLEMLPGPLVPLPKRKFDTVKSSNEATKSVPRPAHASQPSTTHSGQHVNKSEAKSLNQKRKEPPIDIPPFPDDPLEYHLKPFDSSIPEGQCAIQPMQGFFCQICRKFYKTENAALVTHCKSKAHYANYAAFIEKARKLE